MTREEAIEILHSDIDNKSCDGCQILCRDLKCPVNEALEKAIKAIKKLDYIDAIIHNTQGIQEDVIRYKMICEVMNK